MPAPRLAVAVLLALASVTSGGCGGRTGLGVWIDGGGPQYDAATGDGAVIPDGGGGGDALGDGSGPSDGGREDAAGKNCADVMTCAFSSLSSGFNWQNLLACTQGSTGSALTESGQLILCLGQNCTSMLMGDGGGQMDILLCLVQHCTTQICACEGIGNIIPPGLVNCYGS